MLFIAFLTVTMVALSFVQVWMVYNTDKMLAYGSAVANQQGLPGDDKRGAFLVLNPNHSAAFSEDLVELLAVTDPGVVDDTAGAHLQPSELKQVLVQSAILSDPDQYRVYRIGYPETDPFKYTREPGGKVLRIEPENGVWQPGPYQVDIPAEGMFGGRTYYQFYVDGDAQK